jgi:WD40 repeat protein
MLWDASTFARLGALTKPESRIRNIAFSPDGARLAITVERNGAEIWDVAARARLLAIPRATGRARFSPDGARLVALSGRGFGIWDAESGRAIAIEESEGAPVDVALSRDGSQVAVVFTDEIFQTRYYDEDNTVRVWDVVRLTQAMATLVEVACSTLLVGDERFFSDQEIGADPLIGDVWTGAGERRDLCTEP